MLNQSRQLFKKMLKCRENNFISGNINYLLYLSVSTRAVIGHIPLPKYFVIYRQVKTISNFPCVVLKPANDLRVTYQRFFNRFAFKVCQKFEVVPRE